MLCILVFLLVAGCEKDSGVQPSGIRYQKGEGVFITQEGNFQTGNGVLSFYNFAKDTLYEGIYEERNGVLVGNVLQGAYFEGNDAYLVVNGSGVIIKFDPSTGNQLSLIRNLASPNDFLIYKERHGIVSDLFGPYLYKIDMLTGFLSDSLFTGGGTGEIAIAEDKLFITKSSDFGAPPSTSVIVADPESLEILDTISVGYNPSSILADGDGHLWVACNGNSFEGRLGSLHRINPESNEVTATLPFPDLNTSYAARLARNADGTQIYFLKGDVYRVSIEDTTFPSEPVVATGGRSLYGLGVRPGNGDIYIGVEDFITESKILIFDDSGIMLREMDSQVGVNNFYFY